MRKNGVGTTPVTLIVALVVLGGAIGWSGVAVLEATSGSVSAAPWAASGALVFFAGLLFAAAWYMYDRVHRKRIRVDPLYAFRLLVLAKASALVGALVTGVYGGFTVRLLPELADPGNGPGKLLTGLAAAVAGVVMVVAALLLERACKRPKDELEAEAEEQDEDEDTR